jgi:hypothetical protein
VVITSAGREGRPRPEGKRSSNIESGKTVARCSAKKASTEPSFTRWLQKAAASRSWWSGQEEPCISQFF